MTEPAAGWYHDPADASAWRWWDGSSWTDHIRSVEETGPQPVQAVVIEPVPTHPPVFENFAPVAPIVAEPVAVAEPVIAEPVAVEEAPVAVEPEPVVAEPVAVEPEPVVAEPTPVSASAIPQPGEVAASPAVSGSSVPLTPTTPIGDQLYWHSAAAEVIEVPRLSHPIVGGSTPMGPRTKVPSYVRDWNDLGSPNTAGVWLLALSPLIAFGVQLAVNTAMRTAGLEPRIASLIGSVASLLLLWVFAAIDARALTERGYHPPRIAWMLLLPPLAYLIARGKAVRRESKAAWPPELVYILSWLTLIGAAVVLASVFLAMLGLSTTAIG